MAQSRALGFEAGGSSPCRAPFSEELNLVMLRQIRARWLVTKASRAAGGFQGEAGCRRAGSQGGGDPPPPGRRQACLFGSWRKSSLACRRTGRSFWWALAWGPRRV